MAGATKLCKSCGGCSPRRHWGPGGFKGKQGPGRTCVCRRPGEAPGRAERCGSCWAECSTLRPIRSVSPEGYLTLNLSPPRWGVGSEGPPLEKSPVSALRPPRAGALPPLSPEKGWGGPGPPISSLTPSGQSCPPEPMPFPVTSTVKKATPWGPALPSRCSFLT